MKLTMKLLALFFGVLMLANIANAESPREQLKQMVEQLQKSPTDNALREKIIKLAQKLKPAPAVPEEAERFEGRAQFAFKNAKSPPDYLDAAKEYEKAIAAAPWVAGYYADLCTIYEKAEKYVEAKKSCEFFLASSPSAQDASDVRKRIAGLEFAIEREVEDNKKFGWLSGKWKLRQDYGKGNYLEGIVTATRSGNQILFTVIAATEYMTFWNGAGQAQSVGGAAGSPILRASLGVNGEISWEIRDISFGCPRNGTGNWSTARMTTADSMRQIVQFDARSFWANICDEFSPGFYTLTRTH